MNIKEIRQKTKTSMFHEISILFLFIITGIVGRTILVGMQIQPFPNFEIIMLLTFLAVLFIRPTLAFMVPLFAMIGSDLLLGNAIFTGNQMNKIIIFTYTGFLLITMASMLIRKQSHNRLKYLTLPSMGAIIGTGVVFVLIYDLWTNIGWWYLGFPHTIEHLTAVMIAGIPFMVYHVLSALVTFTLIAIPIGYLLKNKTILPQPLETKIWHRLPLITITILLVIISFIG